MKVLKIQINQLVLLLSINFLLTKCDIDSATKLPFCDHCKCTIKNNESPIKVDVSCTEDVKNILKYNATWFDLQNNNQSYPYSKLTLNNQRFNELNFTFPTSNLTYLNLAKNEILRIVENVFRNLQHLEVLILNSNDLEDLRSNAFKGLYAEERLYPLRALRELRLAHNQLHSLPANIFEHTSDLEILDISYNPFRLIDDHTKLAIDSLPSLKELYLSYTGIATLPDLIMHTPKYLSILDLSGNPIEKIPGALSESHNLTVLYLNDTAFVNLTSENGFPKIPTLKILYLCNLRKLEMINQSALGNLENLQELNICNNIELKHIDELAFANIQNQGTSWPLLNKLNLYNNKLTYLDSDLIARWDFLTDIDIRDNPWTCECENQWMIDELIGINMKTNNINAIQVRCAAPVEMEGVSFVRLAERHYKMRCLDYYGAHPENDASILIGVLAGILLALPIVLFLIFAYQRKWFGFFSILDNSPASYSRRFYRSTRNDEDF